MAWPAFLLSLRLLFRRIGILFTANLLWLLLSLLIIPLPAATAGLFYLAYRVVQEERDLDPRYARVGDFWVGVRRFGWRSTLLWILDVVVLLLLGITFRFYWESPVEMFRWLVGPVSLVGLVWLGAQLYLFPLLIVEPERPLLEIARRAVLTAIGYPLDTLLLLIWLLLVALVCTLLTGPVFLILFSFLALAQTMALRFIRIRRGEIEPVRMVEE